MKTNREEDEHDDLMKEAFEEAEAASDRGECPVGALLVKDGTIVARAGGEERRLCDPTAHAEILVLRRGGSVLGTHAFRIAPSTRRLWPCLMWENALLRAKVPLVARDARSFPYIYESTFSTGNLTKLGPIMEEECRGIFLRWIKESRRDFILEGEAG